ncbi:MAG: alginate O-acetyltransferase complex protein AlgI [Dokdonia sp.]|jgi:alginate O-acetyltransferase complex protein AlgI
MWIFFRSENLDIAFQYIINIFSSSIFSFPTFISKGKLLVILLFLGMLLFIEWKGKNESYALKRYMDTYPKMMRWSFYSLLILFIGVFSQSDETPFIYFQF